MKGKIVPAIMLTLLLTGMLTVALKRQRARDLEICVYGEVPAAITNNAVVNPGFETGDFTGWTQEGPNNAAIRSDEHYTGDFSCASPGGYPYRSFKLTQKLPSVLSDWAANVGCWYKWGVSEVDWLRVNYTDGSVSSVGLIGNGTISSWRYVTLNLTPDKTVDSLMLERTTSEGVIICIDDVELSVIRPTFSDISYSTNIMSLPCTFSCKWSSEYGLSGYVFGTNNTGCWINETWSPLTGNSAWANVTNVLNSTYEARIEYRWWCNDTAGRWGDSEIQVLELDGIIIDSDQTWQGDFIVNEGDYIIVENCDFTVIDGSIYVYGCLTIKNSTIHMKSSIQPWKWILAYGHSDLIIAGSVLAGSIGLLAEGTPTVRITNSSVNQVYLNQNPTVYIADSTFQRVTKDSGQVFIDNSVGFEVWQEFLVANSTNISNSNITSITLLSLSNCEVELKSGQVDNLTISDEQTGAELNVLNSSISEWFIDMGSGTPERPQSVLIKNSTIASLYFVIGPPLNGQPVDLTLKTGRVDYQSIYIEHEDLSTTNITIMNSTIKGWELVVWGGIIVQLEESNCSLRALPSCVFISNSTIPSLVVQHIGDPGGNLTVENSQVGYLQVECARGESTLVLQSGFQEYFCFYNQAQNSNITLRRTTVSSWGLSTAQAQPETIVRLYNSSLAYVRGDNSAIFAENCIISKGLFTYRASFVLENSSLTTLYAYGDSNITAIDSEIGVIISDPPYIRLDNSVVLAEVVLPYSLSQESIGASFSEENPLPLPEGVIRMSEYLSIDTVVTDYLPSQVKLHYDENELKELGIDETELRMYQQRGPQPTWEMCELQGIDESANYVWANVSDLSCFAIGAMHDVEIRYINASRTILGKGYSANINVGLTNTGELAKTFNVTVYCNNSYIASQLVSLSGGNSTSIVFEWNTEGLAIGNYTTTAKVTSVLGEAKIIDDTLTSGRVLVTIPGDVDGDFENGHYDVGLFDAVRLLACYGAKEGDSNFDPNCDIDNDGRVFLFDAVILLSRYGQKYP